MIIASNYTDLIETQRIVVDFPKQGGNGLWVHGLAGSGKTTALVARMLALIKEGVRPDQILVLVSDRSQRETFEQALAHSTWFINGSVTITTFYGLCQRAVALFWPLVSGSAGFKHPELEPTFMNVESTQYHMARILQPLVQENGYFADITIRRERLLSQLIDNLNKSALVGFAPQEIASRLISAWAGSEHRYASYQQAQDCAMRFRAYCLAHSLLDLSLTTQLFVELIYPSRAYKTYLAEHVRHLIADNIEETVPVASDYIAWLQPLCASSVLAEDEGGGYRIFLGADRQAARNLGERCSQELRMDSLPGINPDILTLANRVCSVMHLPQANISAVGDARRAVLGQRSERYWVGMIRWIANEIAHLVEAGCAPGEIAVVAPYVSEVMRFALEEELHERGIGQYLLRPATPLRDDVIVRAGLTLARLAHPTWASSEAVLRTLPVEDLAEMLGVMLANLDPVRARLLAESALPQGNMALTDLSGQVQATAAQAGMLWQRLGFQLRERYEALRTWLADYAGREQQPLDIFLSQIFGELLTLPGYGFYLRADLAHSYSRLVESALKFRLAGSAGAGSGGFSVADDPGAIYTAFVLNGLASAEYIEDRLDEALDAVILAPAFAYLTRGLRSRYQFWCDLRVDGWWNRPNQPLTQPYVLSRAWQTGRIWYDADEDQARREGLGRVLIGLAARCSGGIFLVSSELGINGEEQSGRLERILQNALLYSQNNNPI
ncbi:MAG: UvrD-helicase domain-containing protein [Chloroflexi bacterium]|nr:UvrD-helicase domain-containing protein [Chloroflexota bacterium]